MISQFFYSFVSGHSNSIMRIEILSSSLFCLLCRFDIVLLRSFVSFMSSKFVLQRVAADSFRLVGSVFFLLAIRALRWCDGFDVFGFN